jgi:hypothetical protein
MANTPRGKAFEDFEPEFSQEEADAAHDAARIVTSFAHKPVMDSKGNIGFLALKLALYDGSSEIILLDRFSAEILHHLIQTAKTLDWKADALKSGNVPH